MKTRHTITDEEKGKFRTCAVFIGGRQGMRWEKVELAIEEWCKLMMDPPFYDTKPGLEEESKQLHIAYEKIHPFTDGNGRTGRMFMNWWRIKNGLPIIACSMNTYQWIKDRC